MPVSAETYERVALEDPEGQWELVCGRLRQKPPMANAHSMVLYNLNIALVRQLDQHDYLVSMNTCRLQISTGSYFIPDICVVPRAYLERNLRVEPERLEVYSDPVPLVVEGWSPSTGTYDDGEDKLREYQLRSDAEIWRIHPYEKTLTAWRRQPNGSYTEALYRGGIIKPAALPNVAIAIDGLFE
jgi:hypothetical protein